MSKNNINLRVLFIMLLSIVMIKTNAQTGLNFQGVARTTNNVILASQAITIKLSILQGSATGTADYSETRRVTTNAQGLFTAVIGDTGAISTLGNFTTINWKLSPKFLKIEMDPTAGTNFITMGTTQFQYVAYAQFAKSVDAENIVGIVPVTLGGTGVNSLTGLKTALTLNNVSNTTDLTKPISTLTQNALDLKLNAADTSKYTKQTYTDSALLTKLNTTGNAATATTAGNITATTNTTLTSLSSLATVGTITSGVWSGTAVAVEKGGTGATTASAARTNLGLVIGTDVQAPLVAGTDYLTPTGSAANLTSFPTLNQNTTGNAATATTATNIAGGASGSLPYQTGLGATSLLAKGSDGQSLILASGVPVWSNLIVSDISSKTASISDPFDFSGTIYASSALDVSTAENLSNGKNVLSVNTNGIANIAFGINVLASNTTGTSNTAFGFNSLKSNTTGKLNSSFGAYALYNNTTGNYNTAIGSTALISNTTGGNNTAIGEWSMLNNTSGYGNLASGTNTLLNNTIGSYNTANGRNALNKNTSGSYNIADGFHSLFNNTTGWYNTSIGVNSLNTNTTGNHNTVIGNKADVGSNNLENATAIGDSAIVTSSNTIQLGNVNITNVKTSGTLTAGTVTYPNSGGTDGYYLKTNGTSASWAAVTVTADAGTLTGTTLKSTVTGSSLTSVGTLANLTVTNPIAGSITGNAATATTAGNITATTNTTLTSLSSLATVGTITSGVWSGAAVAIEKGGTGLTAAGTNGQVLTSIGSGTLTWTGTHYIGESYGGGIVFYVYDNGKHGLIAATSDQSTTGIRWYGGTNTNTRARADGVGAGLKNTALIIAVQSGTYSPAYDGNDFAATVCNEYSVTVDGVTYGDWYLPSKYELNLMYTKIGQGAPSPNTNVGGFMNDDYWSSTENDVSGAWYKDFSNSLQGASYKVLGFHVRAIRAF